MKAIVFRDDTINEPQNGWGGMGAVCPTCQSVGDFFDVDERATHALLECSACLQKWAACPLTPWIELQPLATEAVVRYCNKKNGAGVWSFFLVEFLPRYDLIEACMDGQADYVRSMLSTPEGVALATMGENLALRCAAAYGCPSIVRMLLAVPDIAARKGACKNEAWQIAKDNGYDDIVDMLEKA